MKYCTKCGSQLQNNVCISCSGKNLNTNEKKPAQVKKKPKKRNAIIVIISLIMIGIFLLISQANPDKEEVIKNFSKAIYNNDSDLLQDIIYCKDERIAINKENTLIIIDYFTKNPSRLNEIEKGFKNDTNSEKMYIEEIGKQFFILPIYKVCVEPTFIKVKTEFEEVKVKIGENVYTNLVENNEIGPLMPGQYSIDIELSNSYLNKNNTIKVDTFNNNEEIILFDDLKTVNITSDIDDSILYVNNHNTGINIKDAKNFGPVDNYCIINAVAKDNEKTIVSNKYNIDDNSGIFINFKEVKKEEEDFKNEIYTLMRNYSSSFAYAVNYNEYNYIGDYIEYGSPLQGKQSEVIKNIHNSNIRENFENIQVLSFNYDKEKNVGQVICNEVYTITRDRNVPKIEEFTAEYEFKRSVDGKLILTDINNA